MRNLLSSELLHKESSLLSLKILLLPAFSNPLLGIETRASYTLGKHTHLNHVPNLFVIIYMFKGQGSITFSWVGLKLLIILLLPPE
jgi:hypothetical protein